jgi:guanylate kinase
MKQKKLIIFTAPSGAGKTTIVRHLLKVRDDIAFSISACTRTPRYGEVNGMDYYFMNVEEFKRKIAHEQFVEFEEVYTNQYYGTLRSEITRLWDSGKNVLFDVDVKGALAVKRKYGDRALAVFVKPPSFDILKQRLTSRKTEDEASLRKRINRVREEMTYERYFDVTVVNDELSVALQEAALIVDNFLTLQSDLTV